MRKIIKRFLGKEASEYAVIGLLVMKSEVDSFTGSITYEMVCRLGDVTNPVSFLPFLEQAQQERQFRSA